MTKFFAKESNCRIIGSIKRFLGSALYLLPLLCAVYVVEPLPLAFAGFLLALWPLMEIAGVRFAGLTLIFLQDVALRHGNTWAIVAAAAYAVLAGILLLTCKENSEATEPHRRWPAAFYPGVTLGAAVMMSFYQCSGYFAVRAQGAGMAALLRSYTNLGFYPNWRTVLFSTILLVVLITWPRKFKSLSKVVPAGFVGLPLVTALNILLNPVAARSAVLELSLPFLPFLRRMPISALSMLLIYAAWEEVPWKKIKACFKERRIFDMILLPLIPVAMFCFDLLWVFAGLALVWGLQKLARLIHDKRGGIRERALIPHS